MYWKNISWKPIVVVEAIISVAYFIVLVAFLRATSYINNNTKKQKAKVFYIKDLQSDIEYVQEEYAKLAPKYADKAKKLADAEAAYIAQYPDRAPQPIEK